MIITKHKLLFTHPPKTGGTVVKDSIIENIDVTSRQIYEDNKELIIRDLAIHRWSQSNNNLSYEELLDSFSNHFKDIHEETLRKLITKLHFKTSSIKQTNKLFENYINVGFIRNPWRRAASLFYGCFQIELRKMNSKRKDFNFFTPPEMFERFLIYIKNTKNNNNIPNRWNSAYDSLMNLNEDGKDNYVPDFPSLAMNNYIDCEMDFLIRCENIQEDYDSFCNKIGIKPIELPPIGLKKSVVEYNDNLYRILYNKETKNLVDEIYKEDIERFGYEYDFKD